MITLTVWGRIFKKWLGISMVISGRHEDRYPRIINSLRRKIQPLRRKLDVLSRIFWPWKITCSSREKCIMRKQYNCNNMKRSSIVIASKSKSYLTISTWQRDWAITWRTWTWRSRRYCSRWTQLVPWLHKPRSVNAWMRFCLPSWGTRSAFSSTDVTSSWTRKCWSEIIRTWRIS